MVPMRVLLLGGGSYVAQFVIERCLKQQQHDDNAHTYVVACTLRSRASALPPRFTSAPSNEDNAEQQVQVYWNVDLMTMVGVRECIQDFCPDVIINCAEQGYKETDAKMPPSSRLTAYGAMKLRFDEFLLRQENLDGFTLRIANVVGPSPPYFPNQPSKFMQWLHQQLFQEKEDQDPLTLWSDEIRSYIYVRDLVEILFALLHRGRSLDVVRAMTLVNVGGLDALSRVELAQRYCGAWQRLSSSTTKDAAHPAPTRVIAPTRRATVNLGYNPPLDARLNTTLLRDLLPSFSWTSTDTFLDEICHELATKLK
ncbi:Methionine adenosyltransferase regulatory beta subunit-related, partial [Globisporangium splendens]